MSLTPRKRTATHLHTTEDVKDVAQYATERAVQKNVPASEVVLHATDAANVRLSNWQDSNDPQLLDAKQSTAIIPTAGQAENLLANYGFEEDRNGDGVPDYWVASGTGTFTVARDTSDSILGSACIHLTSPMGTGNAAILTSDFVPVVSGAKVYIALKRKGSGSSYCYIYWYKRDKTASATSPTQVISSSAIDTVWTPYNGETTVPSDATFAKVQLRTFSTADVRFDEIVFSSLRTAISTAGTVAGNGSMSATSATLLPNGAWTDVTSITVPNGSGDVHDVYFMYACFKLSVTAPEVGNYIITGARAKVGSDYYPSSSGITFEVGGVSVANTSPNVELLFTFPKDMRGQIIVLQMNNISVYNRYANRAWLTGWGHSPHVHR